METLEESTSSIGGMDSDDDTVMYMCDECFGYNVEKETVSQANQLINVYYCTDCYNFK